MIHTYIDSMKLVHPVLHLCSQHLQTPKKLAGPIVKHLRRLLPYLTTLCGPGYRMDHLPLVITFGVSEKRLAWYRHRYVLVRLKTPPTVDQMNIGLYIILYVHNYLHIQVFKYLCRQYFTYDIIDGSQFGKTST